MYGGWCMEKSKGPCCVEHWPCAFCFQGFRTYNFKTGNYNTGCCREHSKAIRLDGDKKPSKVVCEDCQTDIRLEKKRMFNNYVCFHFYDPEKTTLCFKCACEREEVDWDRFELLESLKQNLPEELRYRSCLYGKWCNKSLEHAKEGSHNKCCVCYKPRESYYDNGDLRPACSPECFKKLMDEINKERNNPRRKCYHCHCFLYGEKDQNSVPRFSLGIYTNYSDPREVSLCADCLMIEAENDQL